MDNRIICLLLTAYFAVHTVCSVEVINVTVTSGDFERRQGEEVTFTARFAKAVSPETIRWGFNNGEMSIGIADTAEGGGYADKFLVTYNAATLESNLKITNVDLSNDGKYHCQFMGSNMHGSSNFHFLNLLIPPEESAVIIEGGDTQNAVEDTVHNLTCIVEGSKPAVDITWLLNNIDVSSDKFSSVDVESSVNEKLRKTVSTLSITPKYSNHGDVYTCKVTGRMMAGEFTKTTVLNVQYPPKISMSIDPSAPSFREGDQVTLDCQADSRPEAVTWKWLLNGEEISGVTGSSYRIASIANTENDKSIKCEATNSIGTTAKEHKLSVHYGPRFTKLPEHVEIDIGDSANFTCEVDGNPAPTIIWKKKGGVQFIKSGKDLSVIHVSEDDIGVYECIATVTSFDNAKAEAYLLKKDVPKITGDRQLTFSQGQTAAITCEASCIPKPSQVIWRQGRDGEIINFDSKSRFSKMEEATVEGVKSVLYIDDLASNDFGEYNCTVTNARGSDTKVFKIIQDEDFPWMYVLIGVGALLVIVVIITVVICCRKRSKDKTSSADSPYWTDPDQCSNYNQDTILLHPYNINLYRQQLQRQRCSLSVVSNTTDNSIKKPADGMEQIMEAGSLSDFGQRQIDTWNNTNNTHIAYDSLDYPNKSELYGTLNSYHATPYTTFSNSNPHYGTYSSQRDSNLSPPPYPQYRPGPGSHTSDYNKYENGYALQSFPDPPMENRLATPMENRLATDV